MQVQIQVEANANLLDILSNDNFMQYEVYCCTCCIGLNKSFELEHCSPGWAGLSAPEFMSRLSKAFLIGGPGLEVQHRHPPTSLHRSSVGAS